MTEPGQGPKAKLMTGPGQSPKANLMTGPSQNPKAKLMTGPSQNPTPIPEKQVRFLRPPVWGIKVVLLP